MHQIREHAMRYFNQKPMYTTNHTLYLEFIQNCRADKNILFIRTLRKFPYVLTWLTGICKEIRKINNESWSFTFFKDSLCKSMSLLMEAICIQHKYLLFYQYYRLPFVAWYNRVPTRILTSFNKLADIQMLKSS